jgi:predicted RNA-binding protein with PIN domain
MRYLIDGYNLLHAMGVVPAHAGPAVLEKARRRLLGVLQGAYGEAASEVTVVFDGVSTSRDAVTQTRFKGIHVEFAHRPDEADDVIERLISQETGRRELVVVSDDRRLQRAARQGDCVVMGCLDYLEEIGRQRRFPVRPPDESGEKKPALSKTELHDWLKAFADLEKDPEWKEFSDPYGFGEIEKGIEDL